MNINHELKSRVSKNSNNVLLLFPNEYLRNLFKREFNPSKNYILVNIHNLEKELVGLRYKEYKYINQDTFLRLRYKVKGDNNE